MLQERLKESAKLQRLPRCAVVGVRWRMLRCASSRQLQWGATMLVLASVGLVGGPLHVRLAA